MNLFYTVKRLIIFAWGFSNENRDIRGVFWKYKDFCCSIVLNDFLACTFYTSKLLIVIKYTVNKQIQPLLRFHNNHMMHTRRTPFLTCTSIHNINALERWITIMRSLCSVWVNDLLVMTFCKLQTKCIIYSTRWYVFGKSHEIKEDARVYYMYLEIPP